LLGATEEYHKQSRCLVSEMITYSGISKIWSKSANHSVTTFMFDNEVEQNNTHRMRWDEYVDRMDEDRWLKITQN
jgi:hypothetical protein